MRPLGVWCEEEKIRWNPGKKRSSLALPQTPHSCGTMLNWTAGEEGRKKRPLPQSATKSSNQPPSCCHNQDPACAFFFLNQGKPNEARRILWTQEKFSPPKHMILSPLGNLFPNLPSHEWFVLFFILLFGKCLFLLSPLLLLLSLFLDLCKYYIHSH